MNLRLLKNLRNVLQVKKWSPLNCGIYRVLKYKINDQFVSFTSNIDTTEKSIAYRNISHQQDYRYQQRFKSSFIYFIFGGLMINSISVANCEDRKKYEKDKCKL